jgi:hypothetical protein
MSMESEPEIDIEQSDDHPTDLSGILDGYKLHTERMGMLLGRWLEAVQVVSEDEDMAILDSLRHRLKMTLDDTSHEKMLRIVSIAIASQVETTEKGSED